MATRVNIPFTQIRAVQRDTLTFLRRSFEQHGDFIEYPVGLFSAFQLTAPDLIEHVLLHNYANYSKDTIQFNTLAEVTGQGLLTSSGDFWLQQRRLAQPAFHRRYLPEMATVIVQATERLCQRWEKLAHNNSVIDLDAEMMQVTLEIIGELLFNADLSDRSGELAQAVNELLDYIMFRAYNPLWGLVSWLPTRRQRRFWRALALLDRLIEQCSVAGEQYSVASSQYSVVSGRYSVASMLAETGMGQEALQDELMTFLIAGHETSASGLTWLFYLLSQDEAVRKQLESEVDGLNGRSPTITDLPQLPYLTQVMQETLRRYPPSWLISRRALADDRLCDTTIPHRSYVIISPYAIHHHPDYWPNPDRFDPDRFAPDQADRRPRFAYIPFGGGPRLCIGDRLAQLEMQLITAMITQRFRLCLVEGHQVQAVGRVTIRPRDGMAMRIERRFDQF
jgi:cytochrome P450